MDFFRKEGVVGKRSNSTEAEAASDRGAVGSDNPGMSNDKYD
jgi:hypothetical protein